MLSACAAESARHRTFCAMSLNLAKEPRFHKVVKVICAEPRLRDADLAYHPRVPRRQGLDHVESQLFDRAATEEAPPKAPSSRPGFVAPDDDYKYFRK